MKSFFSCYFYPTKVVCIDDDLNFLKWLKPLLEKYNNTEVFYDPFTAVDFLKQQTVITSSPSEDIEHAIRKIHELIYSQKRFHDISTLIVDYHMPGMDGLALCRLFGSQIFKKIMLTGEADQVLAVAAFNEGIIDQLVMKGQNDSMQQIEALVHKTEYRFFLERTQSFSESLLNLDPATFSYLSDNDFSEKIMSLLDQKGIIELYLFNETGDYLLVNAYNKIWWLSIKNSHACEALKKEAKIDFLQEPSPEAEAVYKSIASGKKLPLFALSKASLEIEEWQDILVSPTEIKTIRDTYQILLTPDIGKAALRYQDIQFL